MIGPFADAHLAGFDGDQLGQFEVLLQISEPLMADWLMSRAAPPAGAVGSGCSNWDHHGVGPWSTRPCHP